MAYTKHVKFTATNRYGCGPDDEDDVYTVDEFKNHCTNGSFIDYDGVGYPVKDNMADLDICIKPSCVSEKWPSRVSNIIPEDATHIVWYNR